MLFLHCFVFHGDELYLHLEPLGFEAAKNKDLMLRPRRLGARPLASTSFPRRGSGVATYTPKVKLVSCGLYLVISSWTFQCSSFLGSVMGIQKHSEQTQGNYIGRSSWVLMGSWGVAGRN